MKRFSRGLHLVLYCTAILLVSDMETLPESASAISDKAAHMMVYSGLGFLCSRFLSACTTWGTLVVGLVSTVFCLFYGVTDELHQYFVPGRNAELGDLIADTIGGLMGSVIYAAFFRSPTTRTPE